jgi:hypothetical protein
MAFVFRSERKPAAKGSAALGPGVYHTKSVWGKRLDRPLPSYESTRPRFHSVKDNCHPGPGQYEHEHRTNEKIVIKTGNEEIKIIDPPVPTACFKSTSSRFHKPSQNPQLGPGSYDPEGHKSAKVYEMQVYKPNIILDIMRVNNYQSIPSIPSNMHAHGYSESEDNVLELIEVRREPEPPARQQERARGVSWQRQTGRLTVFDTTRGSTLGPGSYEVGQAPKSVSSYLSQTRRDYVKGELTLKHLAQKIALTNQSYYREKEDSRRPESTQLDSSGSEDEYEFVDQTTPGPGYYQLPSSLRVPKPVRTPKPHKARFPDPANASLGPGTYEPRDPQKLGQRRFRKNMPFLSGIQRFCARKEEEKPGPGAYDNRTDIQSEVLHKLQSGYKGKFGSI